MFLQDCPGFTVGKKVEHSRLLYKAMMLLQAVSLARTPKLTVVLRKGYGLAYFTLGGMIWGDTRIVLAAALRRLASRLPEAAASRPLSSWPNCW